MRKLVQILAVLTLGCSSANASLIHYFSVKNKGSNGYDRVGSFSNLFVEAKWCKDPGRITCPWTCGESVAPNGGAGNGSKDLAVFERQFIKEAMHTAEKSDLNSGLITSVFLVDGVKVLLTAQFDKETDKSFTFVVVRNNTYEENLKELSSINEDMFK